MAFHPNLKILIKNKPILATAGIMLLCLAVFIGFTVFAAKQDSKMQEATYAVTRGPLTISVIASGAIKSREQVIIKNEVEGRTSLIYLIPEGTLVKKGDRLVELDASKLRDDKIDQEIKVQNAAAAFVVARENLAVVENQADADVEKAKVVYELAKGDLQKYTEGEYPNQVNDLEAKITLAHEERTRAKERMEWSKRLFDEKYLSEIELAADELTMKRKELELELAKNNLNLLVHHTHKRTMAQLESDLKQAEMTLDRTAKKAKAEVIQAKANLEAKDAEYRRQKDKLAKIDALIEKAKIYAPADGLVIHATSAQANRRRAQPLEEGQEVRERQELIYLPSTGAASVEVSLHESNLDKVRPGLSVKVTVDALPGETFWGQVGKIALLPDAQSAWMNPDLKVYNTEIYLNNTNVSNLRAGMNCKAEIIVEQHKDATYIPVQAVLRVGGEPTVYVLNGRRLAPRKVKVGLDNNRVVRIIKGLIPGELVSLTPPLAAAATEHSESSREDAPSAEGAKKLNERAGDSSGEQARSDEKKDIDGSFRKEKKGNP